MPGEKPSSIEKWISLSPFVEHLDSLCLLLGLTFSTATKEGKNN